MTAALSRRRFTIDDYHRMAEAGVLSEDDRVELLEGEVIVMSPIGNRHAACVERLVDRLKAAVSGRAMVRAQNPVVLSPDSEPEPDLAVVKPRDDYYASQTPGPRDVYFLVEVAETSLEEDRAVKVPLYARHGVPEAWLVDLAAGRVEVFSDPAAEGYRSVERCETGMTVTARSFPGLSITVREILGG